MPTTFEMTAKRRAIRNALKAGAESGLLWSGAATLRRAQHRSRTLVLAYHNIVPDGATVCGDSSLHLSRRRFAAQLDELVRTHDIVPLDSVLDGEGAAGGRPRAVITFDDAYQGAVTAGTAELARRGLPATIFVAPAFVGGASFWWDCISDPGLGRPTDRVRDHALSVLRGDDGTVRAWAERSGLPVRSVTEFACAATEAQLLAAARQPRLTFGSHTWSHPNLAALPPAEVAEQLTRPLRWLRDRFDNVVSWLTYPYGISTPAVEAAAAAAGYRGALRVTGGWLPETVAEPFGLPRLDVSSGISIRGFRLRSSGLFCG